MKGHNEKKENVTKIEKKNAVFSEVIITKISDYQNPEIKSLEINFDKFTYFLKFVEDRTYLRYLVAGKLISDWEQVSYNFNYGSSYEEAETKIKILYNADLESGFLILPGYTEEYPVYNEYLFNTTEIKYQENLTITDFQCFKLTGNKFIGVQKGENVEFQVNDCILKKEIPDIIVGDFISADLQKISKTEKPQNIILPNHNIESFIPIGMFTIDEIVESVTSSQDIKSKFNF